MTNTQDPVVQPADRSKLDVQTSALLERLEADPFLDPTMTPDQMRAAFDSFYASLPIESAPLESINDVVIDGPACPLRLRVYTPQAADDALRPIILFIHGGAAMMGGIESYDGVCRRLATQADAILVSATYRLAPEHKFPAAPDDTWAVLNWVVAQAASLGGDSDKLVIVGESGGGGLAAGCTLRARDEGKPKIAYQILINPALGRGPETDSMRRYGRGFFFEPEALDWILSQVLADPADLADWRASPMLATNLNDLPPTYFVLAGHDILRTDIEQFAERMSASGVDVESECYESTIHGFTVMAGAIDVGLQAIDECGRRIRKRFS